MPNEKVFGRLIAFYRGAKILCVVLLLTTIGNMPPGIAQMSDGVREFTLQHLRPRADSRSQWRIPEAYLSPHFHRRPTSEPTTIIVMDAALPDMRPWWNSGLSLGRDDDLQRHVSIKVGPSYDWGMEKRVLPALLKDELELFGEYDANLLRYRQVRKNGQGQVTRHVRPSMFYLIPKEQRPGRAVHFTCERRCIAYADFSEIVTMEYGFAIELVGDWRTIDQKVRDLLAKFNASPG